MVRREEFRCEHWWLPTQTLLLRGRSGWRAAPRLLGEYCEGSLFVESCRASTIEFRGNQTHACWVMRLASEYFVDATARLTGTLVLAGRELEDGGGRIGLPRLQRS